MSAGNVPFDHASVLGSLNTSKELNLMKGEVVSMMAMIADTFETSFALQDLNPDATGRFFWELIWGEANGNSCEFTFSMSVSSQTARTFLGRKVQIPLSSRTPDSISVREVEYYHAAFENILNSIAARFPHFEFAFGFYARPSST